MDAPLSRHLARFASPRSAGCAAWPPRAPSARPVGRTGADAPRPAEHEIESRLAAARADAKAEARSEVLAEAEAAAEARLAARLREIEDERALAVEREAECRHAETERAVEAAVTRARAEWAASGAAELLPRLDEGLAALHGRLAAALADALRPLLAEAVTARALAAFAAALDQLLADPARPAVLVRGPAVLVAALRGMRGAAAAVAFEEAEGTAELVLLADGARVETRLAAALAALSADPSTPDHSTAEAERDASP